MKKTINVFVSQPMHGIATPAVMDQRQKALDDFRKFGIASKWFTEDDEIVDINPCWSEPATSSDAVTYYTVAGEKRTVKSTSRLWYLGRSIQTMADADYVIFVRGWSNARGCKVEFQVCEEYFKHHLYPHDNMCFVVGTEDEPTIEGIVGHIWFGKDDS